MSHGPERFLNVLRDPESLPDKSQENEGFFVYHAYTQLEVRNLEQYRIVSTSDVFTDDGHAKMVAALIDVGVDPEATMPTAGL